MKQLRVIALAAMLATLLLVTGLSLRPPAQRRGRVPRYAWRQRGWRPANRPRRPRLRS